MKPYEIVRLATADAVERSRFLADSAKVAVGEVRPWLEAMSIRGLRYGAAEVRAQIQGAYDAGATGWALWNPASRFSEFVDALRPASGGPSPVEQRGWRPPTWDLPRERLSRVTQRRDRRALAAADSAGSQGPAQRP